DEPPYAGPREQLRDQARAGDTAPALARLDGCEAEGELIALAKKCLGVHPDDRPADAGVVAQAMMDYFTGVQDRLRAAELDRAAAPARIAEERKRRRLTVALAAVVLLFLAAGGVAAWAWQRHLDALAAEDAVEVALAERDLDSALADAQQLYDAGLKQADDPER